MQLKNILLASLLAFTANSVFANNIWTSNQGGPAHTGYVAIKTNPEKFLKLWERNFLGSSKNTYIRDLRSSVIVDGLAYYLVEEFGRSGHPRDPEISNRLIALDTNTGEMVWSVDLVDDTRDASLHYVNGMLVLHENKAIGPSEQARLIMFEPKTGKTLYSVIRPERASYVESDENNLYEAHHHMFWRHVWSFDPKQLTQNWEANIKRGNLRGFAVSNRYVLSQYPYNDMNPMESDQIYVHDRKTGAESVVITLDKDQAQVGYALPVIDDNTDTAYLRCYDKSIKTNDVFSVWAFDLSQGGKIKWKMPGAARYLAPVVAGKDVLMVDNKQQLIAIDAATGNVSWSWKSSEELSDTHSPIATDDVIFVAGKKNTYAISRRTHQIVWKFNKTGQLEIGDNKLFIRSAVNKGNSCDTCDLSYEEVTAIGLGEGG